MVKYLALRHRPQNPHRGFLCLLLTLSLTLASAAVWAAPVSILDASFEGTSGTAPDGWATWGKTADWSWDSSVGRTGSRALSVSNSRWDVGWSGPTFNAEGSYASVYPCHTLMGWIRCDFTTGRTHLTIAWYGPDGWICNTNSRYAPTSTNGKWVKLSLMALPPVGATSGQVFLRSDKNEGTVWFDDVSVEVTELPVSGAKPTEGSPEGGQLAPYRCLIRDHGQDALAGEAHLTLAIQYMQADKQSEAKAELDSFATNFPGSDRLPEGKLLAAEIACSADAPDAEDLLRAIADSYPTSEYAPVAAMKITYLHARKGEDRRTVRSEFIDLATRYPDSPCAMECRYRAAKLDLRHPSDFVLALDGLQHVQEKSGDRRLQAEAMVDIGLAHLERFLQDGSRSEDLPEALQALQGVKAEYPEQTNAIARAELRLGRYYLYTEKDVTGARQVFTDCLSTYPTTTNTELRYQLAYCSFAEGMYWDSASKCLEIIADQDVDWGWKAWCKIFVGHCYLKMEDYDSAREAFQSVISLYPDTDFAEASQGVLDLMSRGLRSEG